MKLKSILAALLVTGVVGSAVVSVSADYAPDYQDKTFKFNFSNFDEDDWTPAARKGSPSSMYFNNTSSITLSVKPQADALSGIGTNWVTANKKGYFTADKGRRYEVQNLAYETYGDGVQVRFYAHYDNIWGAEATIKWSPDYTPDGASVIGL